MSEIGRIFGVFFSPGKTFADVAARPRWYIPMILLTVLSICFVYVLLQHIGMEQIVRQGIEQSSRTQNMTAEQRDQAIAMGVKFGSISTWIGASLGSAISIVIVAAVLMLVVNGMFGAKLSFGQMMGITGYSFLTGLITVPLTILVMYLKPAEDFNMRNPLAFNLGAFLTSDGIPKWLTALGTSIDVFTFWTMALLAIGISVASKRLSWGKAFTAVLIPWILMVLVKTGWVAAFG